jgi:hypothetical protein
MKELRQELLQRIFMKYNLLGFLSGLKEEIADVILLYNPTILKQAYKLSRQIEKSLGSQTRMLKPLTKNMPYSSAIVPTKTFKPSTDKSALGANDNSKALDSNSTKTLTLDQKRALGLCFHRGDKFFAGHECKLEEIYMLEEDEPQEPNSLLIGYVWHPME